MIRLHAFIPAPTDATSWYRGVGPLQTLRRRNGNFELVINPVADWSTLKGADCIFMQRPCADHHVKLATMAQLNRKPMWVDFDDDLYCVPPSNRTFGLYGNQKIQNNITEIVCRADYVSVSTPRIKDVFCAVMETIKGNESPVGFKLDPNKVVVIPNAYDEELLNPLLGLMEWKQQHQRKLVMWRGSGTHDKDLWEFTPELRAVVDMHREWSVNFTGEPFWLTIERLRDIGGQRITTTATLDPIEYLDYLTKTAPALVIVPLDEHPFNYAKSNCVWLEATHAGAVVLAPDWPEWRRPGILNYRDKDEFRIKLDGFCRGEVDGRHLWNLSREWIFSNLTLSVVNAKRAEILLAMYEGR
jgi:hypothetical protein